MAIIVAFIIYGFIRIWWGHEIAWKIALSFFLINVLTNAFDMAIKNRRKG